MDFLKRVWDAIVNFFNEEPARPTQVAKPTESKAKLGKYTKAQLAIKGRALGVDIDQRQVKSKIVNEVYKAQAQK